MGSASLIIGILSIMVLSKLPQTMANPVGSKRGIYCFTTIKHIEIVKVDQNGKSCSAVVPIRGCEGRCPSFVMSNYNLPIYDHSVCLHDRIENKVWNLKCDDEAGMAPETKTHRYFDAVSCKCGPCDSSTMSCEGAHKRAELSYPKPQEEINDIGVPETSDESEMSELPHFIQQILHPPVYA